MAAVAPTRTPAQMVEFYIKLRDHKRQCDEEYKKSMERVNLAMEKIEGELLTFLKENGSESLRCDSGTVYRKTQDSATVEDRQQFLDHVLQTGDFDALDVKANKTFIKTILEEGKQLPPGVKYTTMHTVGVRRS
jgi:hypothetical protein